MGKQIIMYGAEVQLERLSKLGDPLEKINAAVNWEIFRAPIRKRVRKEDYSKGGRPPTDEIMMFKITLLQDWNNVSDDSMEYLINDRLSFQRFLGMELGEKSPKTTLFGAQKRAPRPGGHVCLGVQGKPGQRRAPGAV